MFHAPLVPWSAAERYGHKYDRYQMMDMFLCPYRFFLDYVMEDGPVIQGNFLYQKYFENLLIEAVWKRIGKQNRSDVMKFLPQILAQETQKLEPYFKFWKSTEILDLRARAKNYLVHEIITEDHGTTVKPYDPSHMQTRKLFGTALFSVDISEVEIKNPYHEFESLARRDGWKKIYSLRKLPKPENQMPVDILRGETKNYLNQTFGKGKTAIPSDWCIYCVHRGNCMESFLCSQISMSSSRNEPRSNWESHTNTSAKALRPSVLESLTVNIEEPLVLKPVAHGALATDATHDEAENAVSASSPPAIPDPTVENTPSEGKVAPNEWGNFEQILKTIQEMVEGNRQEIQSLKGELTSKKSRREDTTRIEARLAKEERRSQELLDKLTETEDRLATTEAQNRDLSHTVKTQDALLERKRALEFTEDELEELHRYSTIIVFDTCSIMNYPNLLDGVNDGELVVVPKDVNNELEHHKTRFGADERKIKAQRAISEIFNYKRHFPLTYAEGLTDLVPNVYRADTGEKEQNDNMILSVALRYKYYTDIPVIFITDDRSLSNKASGEGLEVWTAKDFLTPPESSFEDVPQAVVSAETVVGTEPAESSEATQITAEKTSAVAEAERRAKAQEEYLAQKISLKVLHLEASQISVLQNNGIRTLADFMAQTESSFASLKVKKGVPFTARFLKEQERIKRKLENL